MRKFWVTNLLIGTVFFILFFVMIFTIVIKVENLDVDYIYIQCVCALLSIAVLQFVFCLVTSIVKFKKQSYMTIFILIYLLSIIFIELSIGAALMGGFLGDM